MIILIETVITKIVYFAHQKEKIDEKKTYFIGVTHEIDGIVNYSIRFLVGVKFL